MDINVMRDPKLKKRINFKDGVDLQDLFYIDPALLVIVGVAACFYEGHGYPFWITSLTDGLHKSKTHAEGRGCDVRTRDPGGKWAMPKVIQLSICFHINQRYAESFGAGPEGCEALKVAVLEDDHIHFQVRRVVASSNDQASELLNNGNAD